MRNCIFHIYSLVIADFGHYIIYTIFHSMVLITFAGMPATTVFGGTSFVTTAAADTTEFSQIVTPGITIALTPIHAFFLIMIGFDMVDCLSDGFNG